ncbi:hypothetical protein KJ680_09300 [bacterium]|nr:hypothetical protein [bacterium]
MNKVDFSKLTKKREDWVRVSKENSFDEGIKKLLTDLYPDNAHFIYELLQNAEDKEGTEVKFKLVEDELRFTHNGEKFNKEHIDGITSIANGTSVNDINKIGKFGVGFKAVFAYTSTPQIYSGEYCFEISDLVVPTVIESIIPDSSETLMVFPFNNPNKSKEEAYREIYKGLNDIKDNTLLFLTNIKKISYSFGDKIHHIERKETGDIIVNITNSKNRTDRKWLRFKKPLPKKEKLYVSVAFEIVIDKSTKEEYVKSIDDGQVSIFFPAEKEKSNLKFHIHAPFSSTVARDSIKDLEENNELRNLISKLLLDVLKYLKRNQLLDYRFLASMPHDGDNLSEFYLPIQKSIVEYFNKEKFLMTDRGIHRSASECFLINTKEARSVLSKNILKDFMFHFYNRHFEKIYYLDSEKLKYKTRQKSFIEMLEIEKFDDTKLFNILEKLANQKDESIVNMIQGESDKWFKALYVFLNQEKSTYFEDKPQFKKFILLSNETLNTSKEDCYFSQRSDIKELLIVKDSVYFRNPEAKSFLEKLGVKEIGEKEKIEIILKENYQNNFVETDRHLEHIQKFIRFYERHKTDIDFFREYKFIRVSEFDGYKKPEEIYIDSPFEKTGMNAIGKDDKSLFSLNEIYHSLEKEKKKIFIEFLKKLGVITQLSIKEENKLTPFFHKYDIWITKIKKKNKNKNSKFTISF